MKIIIIYLISGLLSSISANAQTDFERDMNQAFELWKNNQPVEAAMLFEQIGKAERNNWLPYYYASQVKIVQAFPMTNTAKKKQLLKEAQQFLDEARNLGGEEVEVLVLQATLHTAHLVIDPATYGMQLYPVINRLYDQALKKAPNNPRVVLSKAEWDIGSARFFGEDPAVYCPDLERSLALFAAEERSALTAPSWGKETALDLINNSCGSN